MPFSGELAGLPDQDDAQLLKGLNVPAISAAHNFVLQHAGTCLSLAYVDSTITATSLLYMISQHHAIGLQNDCMAVVLGPVVRLPDSHMYALWP